MSVTDTTAERPRLSVESVLMSGRVKDLTPDPIYLFTVDDFLPADVYQELLATFPGEEYFVTLGGGNYPGKKRVFVGARQPEAFQQFLTRYPVWQELFDQLATQAFIDEVYRLLRPGLLKARGLSALKPWRKAVGAKPSAPPWAQLIQPHFGFSRLDAGAFVPPHTDIPAKLASLILYFPEPGWQDSYGGVTAFYRLKDRSQAKQWENHRADTFDKLETVKTIAFKPNRLVVFAQSTWSYHAVPEITCPPGMVRNSLNFNYLTAGTKLERMGA